MQRPDEPANDGVTYTGFVNGESENTAGIFGSSTLSYTYNTKADGSGTPYTAGCDNGTYYVIPSGLTAANYDITFVAGYGSCYRGIQWTTSDPTRATVNNSGVVGVVDNAPDGEFIITATTTNDKKASLTFKIVDQKLTIDTDQLNQSLAQ